jgi:acyl carrier protein
VTEIDRAKVKEIIAGIVALDEEYVTDNACLVDDLGADSLDFVEIAIELEEVFGIEVDDDAALLWRKVEDVLETVAAERNGLAVKSKQGGK